MKAKSLRRPVTVTSRMTAEQFARLNGVAKLLGSNIEDLMVAFALANLDGCADTGADAWHDWQRIFSEEIDIYAEQAKAYEEPEREHVEDGAPKRLRRMAGLPV